MADDISDLIATEKEHLQLEKDGRVKCLLNGHIMPANKTVIGKFLQGAKFKRFKERKELEKSFEKYDPFIIQSKNRPEKLYCALTCMLIGKNLASLKKHMKGKKFLTAKEKFEKDEHDLMEEPDFESESESEEDAEQVEEDVMDGLEDLDMVAEPDSISSPRAIQDDTQNGAKEQKPGAEKTGKQKKRKTRSGNEGRNLEPEKKRAAVPSTAEGEQGAAPQQKTKHKKKKATAQKEKVQQEKIKLQKDNSPEFANSREVRRVARTRPSKAEAFRAAGLFFNAPGYSD